jgi:hypothetical protein
VRRRAPDRTGIVVHVRALATAVALALVAGLSAVALPAAAQDGDATGGGADDAVVIAVVDSGFSPYHLNWRASGMPAGTDPALVEHLEAGDDPATWLPGYRTTPDVASTGAIDLTLPDDPGANVEALEDADAVHEQLPRSRRGAVHLRRLAGTKIIGAVDFAGGTDGFFGSNTSHGNGTSSVAAGNIHGSCPECLVVLVRYGSGAEQESASDWAMSQPWIDVVTNSFGFSTVNRDRIYDGADTELQREASERGQTILFSSGNGQENAFVAPNTTLQSSQEGPDWIITVGGTAPNGANYQGAGKPADVASIGSGYPSGYGGATVSGTGNFSGTSNATPVVAGIYAKALWTLRRQMDGPSRSQADGVVATGAATCGSAVADCAIGDGELTATELRFGLLHAAVRTPQGITPTGLVAPQVMYPAFAEGELLSEGHGTFFGRVRGDGPGDQQLAEELARVVGPLAGTQAPLQRTADERDWMLVDSWCRQQVHGSWEGGYYVEGSSTLPAASPAWPIRTALLETCPEVFGTLKDAGTAPAPQPGTPEDG